MRVSIVLAICFLGVASASPFDARNLFESFGNKSQEALHNLEHFGQEFQQKLQDALKTLLGNQNSSDAAVVKREAPNMAADSLALIANLGDPAKFAQSLLKVLGDMALQGRRKREAPNMAADSLALIANLGDPAKFAQSLLKVLGDMALQGRRKRETPNMAADSLALIANLGDPAKFAQSLLKVLADMALQGRRKRDLAEDLKKFAEAGKQRAQDAFKHIMDMFNSFKNGGASDETSTEKTVAKRDISEDLEKLASAGQEKVQAALKQLQGLFDQLKNGFNHDQSSATVTKRDIAASLKEFGHAAHEKAEAALAHLQSAFADLFKMGPFKPVEQVVDAAEDTTESL